MNNLDLKKRAIEILSMQKPLAKHIQTSYPVPDVVQLDDAQALIIARAALGFYIDSPELIEIRRKAARYDFLRERDLDTIEKGGVFAGNTPQNIVLNGVDLDEAVDQAMHEVAS